MDPGSKPRLLGTAFEWYGGVDREHSIQEAGEGGGLACAKHEWFVVWNHCEGVDGEIAD